MTFATPKLDRQFAGLCLALALGTFFLFLPVFHHEFITLDDNQYVTANPQVQAGPTWASLKWAFRDLSASNWFPLTWISHMLDCWLFGLKPGWHHLTNVFFHIANTLLLFTWLNRTTGALWRSALVAALFAWHPLRVESVAWVAERKDVLSAFFWLLTLLAYTRYVRLKEIRHLSFKSFYTLALLGCAAALMSKPMAVTLPFVLLLADFWPLNRAEKFTRLVTEKIPFLALAAGASVMNYIAQKGGGATWTLDALPLYVRIANAVVSYLRYISKTFWPADLAIIYPYEKNWPLWLVIAAITLLLLWSVMVVYRLQKNPFLFFGWFYFAGVLFPTIGLVQAGPQAMADRYSYLPSIGLFIAAIWGANELLSSRAWKKPFAVAAAIAALSACAIVTTLQLNYWKNSVKLFAHAVEVTTDNYVANAYLGGALEVASFHNEALPFYFESVRITPHFTIARWALGMALLRQGRATEATEHLATAARQVPEDPVIQCYTGKALTDSGNLPQGEKYLSQALQLKPDFTDAHFALAVNLARQAKFAEAIPHFSVAAKLDPANFAIRFNYGLALLDAHQPSEASVQFTEALRLSPNDARAHYRLARALEQQEKFSEALAHFRAAAKLSAELTEALNAIEKILTAHPELK